MRIFIRPTLVDKPVPYPVANPVPYEVKVPEAVPYPVEKHVSLAFTSVVLC